MKNYSFKLLVLSVSVLFFVACSSQKDASGDVSNAPKTEKRGQKGGKQEKGERPTFSKLLTEMDKNKDGKLSKDEVQGPLKNDFSKIDKNSDGFITEDEFKNAAPSRGPRQ